MSFGDTEINIEFNIFVLRVNSELHRRFKIRDNQIIKVIAVGKETIGNDIYYKIHPVAQTFKNTQNIQMTAYVIPSTDLINTEAKITKSIPFRCLDNKSLQEIYSLNKKTSLNKAALEYYTQGRS